MRRSLARGGGTVCIAGLLLACSGDAASVVAPPPPPPPPPPPTSLDAPAFVFVADSDGRAQLFRFRNDTIALLSTSAGGNDFDPKSAAARLVFTSDRDGNEEVYISDLEGSVQHRVTNGASADDEPALDPAGATIAFVSDRSGTPLIWLVGAPALDATTLGTPTVLATGLPTFVPERSPAWSPDGRTIAFTSPAEGKSQLYIVPADGGTAVRLTNESDGAFWPTWDPSGESIYYVAATSPARIRQVSVATHVASDFARDSLGLGAPACVTGVCLSITDPFGASGSVVALSTSNPGDRATVLARTSAAQRQPAVLVP